MNTLEKLRILAADSQYDLACSCGSSDSDRRKRSKDGASWLYPVPMASGGTGIMYKTLVSNVCSSDCRYCPLRHTADTPRCSMSPDEIADSFLEHLRHRWLIGLFLSSGVQGTPDRTMERLIAGAEILRKKHNYRGYIHLKIIPGAGTAAIDAALRVASAVSLNIEVPGKRHFEKLSTYKNFDRDIVRPLRYISEQTGKGSPHSRIRTTTQFIVGASDETDGEIIKYLDAVYNRLRFGRAYFSAYQSGLGDPAISGEMLALESRDDKEKTQDLRKARLMREHRLYQADFLLRRYGFAAGELVFDKSGNFDLTEDPKLAWARLHSEHFPVSLKKATREELLRVPGLGPTYVERILKCRREGSITSLSAIGLRGKNAEKASRFCILE